MGINADRARLTTALAALDNLDCGDADDVYWATRLTLCSEPDDLPKAAPATVAPEKPRDVFVYFITEGKVRAPFGARALMERVSG